MNNGIVVNSRGYSVKMTWNTSMKTSRATSKNVRLTSSLKKAGEKMNEVFIYH